MRHSLLFGGCRYFNGSTNCMSINIEKSRKLALVVDMYGCPNRCRHCWLGRLPNIPPENGADEMLVNSFRPHFEQIEYYSWLREPDFCGEYRARWERDKALSVNCEPQRFELASFWRLVRDGEYAKFLREVGVKVVQLTFFGGEETTDRYIGRKGAYSELLKATEILLQNGIAPRWQAFINAENKDEVAELPKLAEKLKLAERCRQIGQNFKFFVHAGSCDGENRKLYPIRIIKSDIPQCLVPYYWQYEELRTEAECVESLLKSSENPDYSNGDFIVLNITNNFDIWYNYTHMSPEWRIGNLKIDGIEEIMRRINEEDTFAQREARKITFAELAERYGDAASERAFSIGDYESYLFNKHLEQKYSD